MNILTENWDKMPFSDGLRGALKATRASNVDDLIRFYTVEDLFEDGFDYRLLKELFAFLEEHGLEYSLRKEKNKS